MTGPGDAWEPADAHDQGLPEEPAGWTDDHAGLPAEPDAWSGDPAGWAGPEHHATAGPGPGPAGLPGEVPADWSSDHAALPAETPSDWSGGTGPIDSVDQSGAGPVDGDPSAGGHADWSAVTADPDGGDDPDPTDPAGWSAPAEDPFPPSLSVDVTPADGGPWADPDLLGSEDTEIPRTDPPLALLSDLSAADRSGGDDWGTVESSDDPAIRTLAAYWRYAG